ncbi:uncharacterized protein J4E84_002210 [Alternaria hordeiaustralica]|uniref:uncharacterized protein n=1 Tax=Alternaria hordeiaustralica TaxID=1187925 RepID=UPI0020C25950|nr:uncharacterized protein J4E84_002210 [Alternaria hordeiaustralica]KAI4693636.1 hypothetical protein J4E84_002210 [Alternaria hordeiaustralica]
MSDSPRTPDALKQAPLSNPRLQIPRPAFQRETTAVDPSEWQAYTPKTSHGFIAMHTSTPEDMHENRGNGKPTAVKDYFSVPKQKQNPILSPNPAPYEPHGFLPLCSVAAVEVDATDYFGLSDRSVKSAIEDASCGDPVVAKDVECDRAPQSEGHVHRSRRPLGEVTHPSGEQHNECDVVPKPEEEQDIEKKPEMVLRGGSGEELSDGDKETADRSPKGDVPDPKDHRREIEANTPVASSRTDVAQKDHTEELNRIPAALNRALEQMLQEVATVCNMAIDMHVASNDPSSTEPTLEKTAGRDDAEKTSQPPTDQPDDSESAHAA